jgi:single-strand DNA-binding protein
MPNLNVVMLMGNLTRDPELRSTPAGTFVCDLGLAVNRTYKDKAGADQKETCFVDVTVWGARGRALSEHFSKGDPIFIQGRLVYETWEKDGQRRNKLKVVGDSWEFVGGRRGAAPPAEQTQDVGEDEIPF